MSSERGFTLVEVLLTVVITSVVVAAIAASIIVGLRTSDQTNQRLAESHDAQMAAAWFVPDVQSADSISTTDTTCAGTLPVVKFEWTDQGVTKVASYVVTTTANERRLTRKYCENGALVSTVQVAHHLAAAGPTLGCPPPTTCASAASTVAIELEDTSGYRYTLRGSRRALG